MKFVDAIVSAIPSCGNKALMKENAQLIQQLSDLKGQYNTIVISLAQRDIALRTCNDLTIDLTKNLQDCQNSGSLAAVTKERDELLKLSKLLTEGPEIPDQSNVRWLQASYIQTCLYEAFPAQMQKVPLEMQLWSDSDYLVCPADQIQLFLDYYTMFWLPNIKPYTVTKWTKLDGTTVDIWALDCDDFSDFLQGIPALNPKWACFPWGIMWANVEGLFMAGGHAFNFVVCCDDNYTEESPSLTPTKGLKLYIIEPQQGQQWSVNTPAGMIVKTAITGYQLKEVKGFFNVKEIWMTKV